MLTTELIDEHLYFDISTGIFTRKIAHGSVKQGSPAGRKNTKGYIRIYLCGKQYQAHRLIWLKFKGEIPSGMEIDHINGIKDDNRLANLRCVTKSVNMQNQNKPRKDNKVGKLGVYLDRGKFAASIWIKGKAVYLGQYNTADEAHQVYLDAKRTMHEGCTI